MSFLFLEFNLFYFTFTFKIYKCLLWTDENEGGVRF